MLENVRIRIVPGPIVIDGEEYDAAVNRTRGCVDIASDTPPDRVEDAIAVARDRIKQTHLFSFLVPLVGDVG